MTEISVTARGKLNIHASQLEERLVPFREKLARDLADQLRPIVPRRSGAMASHVAGRVQGSAVKVGVFGSPGARAQDRGAYIVASGADERFHTAKHPFRQGGPRALRIVTGDGVIFRPWVRIPAQRFMERALAAAPRTIDRDFGQTFGNLDTPPR
jgi:hypothetical protein